MSNEQYLMDLEYVDYLHDLARDRNNDLKLRKAADRLSELAKRNKQSNLSSYDLDTLELL